jgi:hypothetical protein
LTKPILPTYLFQFQATVPENPTPIPENRTPIPENREFEEAEEESKRIAALMSKWTSEEIEVFEKHKSSKDFHKMSKEIEKETTKTKTTAECVAFYFHQKTTPLPSDGGEFGKKKNPKDPYPRIILVSIIII